MKMMLRIFNWRPVFFYSHPNFHIIICNFFIQHLSFGVIARSCPQSQRSFTWDALLGHILVRNSLSVKVGPLLFSGRSTWLAKQRFTNIAKRQIMWPFIFFMNTEYPTFISVTNKTTMIRLKNSVTVTIRMLIYSIIPLNQVMVTSKGKRWMSPLLNEDLITQRWIAFRSTTSAIISPLNPATKKKEIRIKINGQLWKKPFVKALITAGNSIIIEYNTPISKKQNI